MSDKTNLATAKRAKNDEFYTLREDIESELIHYGDHLRGKTVYCNCDNPESSEFWKFFEENFDSLGLSRLVSTCYESDPDIPSYSREIVRDDNGNKNIVSNELSGNGDFRSSECVNLLKQADLVITNPPFSLFREYMSYIMKYEKEFLVIGSMNAITYKEFSPLIKDNRVWVGCSYPKRFRCPDGGEKVFGNICWYTNLGIPKRHEPLDLSGKTYEGHEDEYPSYANFDGIDVSKVADIPEDYDGVMGVPISFVYKYCPEQFEIVGFRKGDDGKDLWYEVDGAKKIPFYRVLIRPLRKEDH